MRKLLGVMILAIGILGFVVPILPGWLFVLGGLAIMKGKQSAVA
ncbi:MAG TPA: hypothetical protein VM577_13500 [Anaerovoracaceae bacterium]|nr:hypothetical protein [Anaerovoracaceae bacterium]